MNNRIKLMVGTMAFLVMCGAAMASSTRFAVQDATEADKFVVHDNGYVGIGLGTAAPIASIQVKGPSTNAAQLRLHNEASAYSNGGGGGVLLHYSVLNNPTWLPVKDDRLGFIYFGSYDNGVEKNTAGIRGMADGPWVAGASYPTAFAFETKAANDITAGRTERMRIASDGRLRLSNQPAAPANNATCTKGDLILDATNGFLYLCSATNSWKRVAFTTY